MPKENGGLPTPIRSGCKDTASVPAPGLRHYRVSTAVNKVANDGPELVAPLPEQG